MRCSGILFGAFLSGVLLTACGGGHALPLPVSDSPPLSLSLKSTASVPPYAVMPLVGVSPEQLDAERAAGRTIPYYKRSIYSGLTGMTYDYRIMGLDPRKSSVTTYIPYVPIFVVFHYSDGTVLDPTKPACGDKVSIEQRFLKGPNIVPVKLTSNGVNMGTTQLGDAFQRAEFWQVLKSSHYHLILQEAKKPIVAHVNLADTSFTKPGVCSGTAHRIGEIPVDIFLKLTRKLVEKYATPTQVPILINYNTLQLSSSGCCYAGDHGAFRLPAGIQTFIYATYNDAGSVPYFPEIQDVNAVTHEIGELFNDPFAASVGNHGANQVPPWGHVGEVNGCSSALEVGDPLADTYFELKIGGFTYHPQELVFFSWFYRQKNSTGTDGKYSFRGTFTTTQPLCV